MSDGRAIAIFDLDETITVGDTTLAFVAGAVRRQRLGWSAHARSLSAGLAAFVRQREKKNLLLGLGLAGSDRATLRAEGERFAECVVAGGLRREALTAIERHRAAGDLLVLASASLDLYVDPIAERLGFDEAISTRTATGLDGRLQAILPDGHCKGTEKARRVAARFDPAELARAVVYSDSLADLPLMRLCGEAFVICRDGTRRAGRASRLGLATLAWS